MKKFQELQNLVLSAETDAVKFYKKGNWAAGARLRKVMQQVKATTVGIRKEVSEIKKVK